MKSIYIKTLIISTLVSTVIVSVYVIVSIRIELKYPRNEANSRRDCSSQLQQIRFILLVFMEKNSGMMPNDFYPLMSRHYGDRKILVCPSRFTVADKAGFLEGNSPTYISSYRLLTPGKAFAEISDGAVVVQEFKGNHPHSVIGEKNYPVGYHVLLKEGGGLRIDFVCSTFPETNLSTE